MMRPQPAEPGLSGTTVLVTGSDLPVGQELIGRCRDLGATTLTDPGALPRDPRAALVLAVSDRVVAVTGPGAATIEVRHDALRPSWTDCRGSRHEGDGPGSSVRDVVDEVLRVVAARLTATASARTAA
jgi:hypothetical protein